MKNLSSPLVEAYMTSDVLPLFQAILPFLMHHGAPCTTICRFSWKKRLEMAISWSKNDFFWPQTSG